MSTLSEKVNLIFKLPDLENKDVIVQEIEALEAFTETERTSIFGSDSILWVLKNFSIRELKKKAKSAIERKEVKVGDLVLIGETKSVKALVVNVTGIDKDRMTVLTQDLGNLKFIEGVSVYDVTVTDEHFDNMQSMLNMIL